MFAFRKIWRFIFLSLPFWDSPFCLITDELIKVKVTDVILLCLKLNLKRYHTLSWWFHCYFEQLNAHWNDFSQGTNTHIWTCWIRSKLTKENSEANQWGQSHVFIHNFEHILQINLLSKNVDLQLHTLKRFLLAGDSGKNAYSSLSILFTDLILSPNESCK